jgi:hypothetical protein
VYFVSETAQVELKVNECKPLVPGLEQQLARDAGEGGGVGVSTVAAVFVANMTHISPYTATQGLVKGAGAMLRAGGFLIIYGPFKKGGEHTSESNATFDESLRGRGLHSSTFQLNLSAFYVTGVAVRGCFGGVKGVIKGNRGVLGVLFCQKRLKLS